MCGLVGMMGSTLTPSDESVFQTMLIADYVRGTDGTGLAFLKSDLSFGTYKTSAPSFAMVSDPKFQDWYKAHGTGNKKVLMGHNRAATRGTVKSKNAHPFHHGNIILCMNGTVTDQTKLPDHKQFEVDSENVCYAIDKIGAEETAKLLTGGFCLTWIDLSDNTMNFLRNDGRPLSIANLYADWYWASEAKMLEWVLGRKNTYQEAPVKYYSADPYTHVKFSLLSTKYGLEHTSIKYEQPKIVVTPPATRYEDGWYEDTDGSYHYSASRRVVVSDGEVGNLPPPPPAPPAVRSVTQIRRDAHKAKEQQAKNATTTEKILIQNNIGHKKGDRIEIIPYAWACYPSQRDKPQNDNTLGMIECVPRDQSQDPYYYVEMHSISRKESEALLSADTSHVTIVLAAAWLDRDGNVRITGREPKIILKEDKNKEAVNDIVKQS